MRVATSLAFCFCSARLTSRLRNNYSFVKMSQTPRRESLADRIYALENAPPPTAAIPSNLLQRLDAVERELRAVKRQLADLEDYVGIQVDNLSESEGDPGKR